MKQNYEDILKDPTIKQSEEEDILVRKNTTSETKSNHSVRTLGIGMSFTDGISPSLWKNNNVDWVLHRDRIRTFFINIWNYESKDESFTPDFRRTMEDALFKEGRVALIKLPNGKIYPAKFTWEKEDEDYYGTPKKITLSTNNDYNGKMMFNTDEKKTFVIIWNNTTRKGTLHYAWERLRQIVRALRDIDNAGILSSPKWGVNISTDDESWVDIMDAMLSRAPVVPMGNIDFTEANVQSLAGEDQADSKINLYTFQLSNLLKLLGLKANMFNKKERMSELEVSRNDEFENIFIKEMFERRKEGLEDAKEHLGIDIKIIEDEIITGENPEKDDQNGELNKAIEEETND